MGKKKVRKKKFEIRTRVRSLRQGEQQKTMNTTKEFFMRTRVFYLVFISLLTSGTGSSKNTKGGEV